MTNTVVLVGAEGLTEMEGLSWWRHATDEETAAFLASLALNSNAFIDGVGRPYWAVVLHPEAPAEAHENARHYRRVVRLFGE